MLDYNSAPKPLAILEKSVIIFNLLLESHILMETILKVFSIKEGDRETYLTGFWQRGRISEDL